MRFKRRLSPLQGLELIHVAPFLNLVFLLFIFFLLWVALATRSGIFVKLPKLVTSDAVKEENLSLVITGEDVIYWNGRISTLKELKNDLGKISNKKPTILIKADRRASIGRIVDVWDLCRELGIEGISIASAAN